MEQISNVTTSLQESFEDSHYKNENSLYTNLEREKVKRTETAEDLLQSFAISSSAVSKKAPPKLMKPPRTEHSHNAASKESTIMKQSSTKSVDQDTVSVTKPKREVKPLKHHRFVISSSEESDGEQATDVKVVNPPPSTDNGQSFTAHLHAIIYPGVIEQAEVVWSDKTTTLWNTKADSITETIHTRRSYIIHPAVPWIRCRSLYKTETPDNIEPSDGSTADVSATEDNTPTGTVTLSDMPRPRDDNRPSDKVAVGNKQFEGDIATETEPRHSSRLRKRKLGHHPSSDSEGERAPVSAGQKKIKLDTPPPDEANEPSAAFTPTGTRTSKRVRRAPVKLRQ